MAEPPPPADGPAGPARPDPLPEVQPDAIHLPLRHPVRSLPVARATEVPDTPDATLLAAVLEAMPARVAVLDLDQRYRFVNREFCAYAGLAAEQLVGRGIAEVLRPEALAFYQALVPRLQAGEALEWEDWTQHPRLGRRYLHERLIPYGRQAGAVSQVIVFTRDLTELKLKEEALAEQVAALQRTEALKAAIVDRALAAIVTTDGAGRVVGFNPAAEAMFGHRAADVLGRSVAEVVIPPRDRAAHDAGMARLAAGGAPRIMGRRIEMRALRADGGEFPIEMVLWRTDVAGTVHYTASIVDLSERHAAALLIERQREALRQAEKLSAMGSLLAGVAHELNNPLAIVLGRATLLEEKTAAQPDIAGEARRVREAAERCGRIVRTFLDLARQKPQQRRAVPLNDLARAAADILAYPLRSHGVALTLALHEPLPPVQADADQLGQVVLNLLVNAQQALAAVPAARRRLRLATGLAEEPDADGAGARVWLRVADQGPGVPAALRERIFEPYFTTKGEGSGTGLGLAVSRNIAREHGGDLLLDDMPAGATDTGASFCLWLPVAPPDAGPEADTAAPASAGDGAAASPAARLLVVDDEPEIADLVRTLLEGAGHEVATAETGELALAMLAEARFDAIVSDLHMPRMDGAALWRAVAAQQPALARRMLFVTGDALSPTASTFLAHSGCPALAKPFGKADLLAAVTALLAR